MVVFGNKFRVTQECFAKNNSVIQRKIVCDVAINSTQAPNEEMEQKTISISEKSDLRSKSDNPTDFRIQGFVYGGSLYD